MYLQKRRISLKQKLIYAVVQNITWYYESQTNKKTECPGPHTLKHVLNMIVNAIRIWHPSQDN